MLNFCWKIFQEFNEIRLGRIHFCRLSAKSAWGGAASVPLHSRKKQPLCVQNSLSALILATEWLHQINNHPLRIVATFSIRNLSGRRAASIRALCECKFKSATKVCNSRLAHTHTQWERESGGSRHFVSGGLRTYRGLRLRAWCAALFARNLGPETKRRRGSIAHNTLLPLHLSAPRASRPMPPPSLPESVLCLPGKASFRNYYQNAACVPLFPPDIIKPVFLFLQYFEMGRILTKKASCFRQFCSFFWKDSILAFYSNWRIKEHFNLITD